MNDVSSPDDVHKLYEELSRRAEAHDWSDDVSNVFSALMTQPTALLTARLEPLARRDGSYASLVRNGDVVLGFYMDADPPMDACVHDLKLTCTIGGVEVRGGALALRPGKMTPFFGDAASSIDFLPIMAIQYSEIHVFGHPEVLQHVSAVYGVLQAAPARSWVATTAHFLPGGAVVRDRYFGYTHGGS